MSIPRATARLQFNSSFTLADALENPRRDLSRIAMPPMNWNALRKPIEIDEPTTVCTPPMWRC